MYRAADTTERQSLLLDSHESSGGAFELLESKAQVLLKFSQCGKRRTHQIERMNRLTHPHQ